MKNKLAILSPNVIDQYSETFIRSHKQLPFDIRFYYNGWLPTQLESGEELLRFNITGRIKKKFQKQFSLSEYALLNSLQREEINYVLAEYGPTACATLNVVQHLKLPMVVHFHGFDASHHITIRDYGEQYKKVFAYATKIIAVSKKMKADILALGCPEHKLVISTYGPNVAYLTNRPTWSSHQFVAVGRFTEKKAPYLTILAFKKVVAQYPHATLVMCGEGELWNTCKNLVKALQLTENIAFKGIVTQEQTLAIMNESIAFVQHSITADNGDSEGTPVAVLEAQAAALPVVATYHAGIPDVVIDNETGLLVDEQDVDGMAANMIRLLAEPGLAQRLGENGRKRISSHFHIEKHLAELEKAILSGK